jgi:hypothetical protein
MAEAGYFCFAMESGRLFPVIASLSGRARAGK